VIAPLGAAARACAAAERFLLAPGSPLPLAVFRLGMAAVGLLHLALVWPYRLALYGPLGLVQWVIGESVAPPWVPRLGWLAAALGPFGVAPSTCVDLVCVAYLASLLALLVGWRTHATGAAAWLLHLALTTTGFFASYGVDIFLHLGFFYCAWMPVGAALALPGGPGSAPPSWQAGLSLRTLQIHLCIVYGSSGLAKARGVQWWTGDAIWRAVTQPRFAQLDLAWLAQVPWLARLAGWSVIAIEVGYPIFVAFPRTRGPWVALACAMHVGIGVVLGLYLFALALIVWNVAAFGVPVLLARRRGTALCPPAQSDLGSARDP
jgi:hypothetical protein